MQTNMIDMITQAAVIDVIEFLQNYDGYGLVTDEMIAAIEKHFKINV